MASPLSGQTMSRKDKSSETSPASVEASALSFDELLRIKRQHELILQAAGEGVFGLDCEGLTTFVNPASTSMLGWTAKELVGKSMHELLHHTKPDGTHYPAHECPVHAAFKDGAVHKVDNEVFWRKDGSCFPVEYTSTPIYENEELVGAVVVYKDVSERKDAEDELLRVKRSNERILAAAGEGIYGIGIDGLCTFVNPASVVMTGWKPEDIIGKPTHDMHHHTKPDGSHYPREECPIYAAFQDGLVHQCDDEVFWRKDGSSFPVEYTSTPIYENEELAGAVVVFRDISERKQNEQELQQAYAEVEQMKQRLELENVYLQEEIRSDHDFKEIVGQSHAINQVLNQIELVAPTMATVLITGESGTGKELIARAIHDRSERSGRPLIRVNCAAIPHELFESEFFGHVRGAFTGAIKDRAGRFELADGGTIFLDEVGEIPLNLQSKLLRVLQEGQYERVGEEQTQDVDVRLIAATNKDLKIEVEHQRFREDLFFRLNVFPVEAVPLRKRLEDIPLLAQHFIIIICKKLNQPEPRLTKADIKQLQSYGWQGNIRELQNVIERAIITSKGNRLQFDLPTDNVATVSKSRTNHLDEDVLQVPYTETERLAHDRENIVLALTLSNNKISGVNGAAEMLGIKPTTLASRIKNYAIKYLGSEN